MGEVFFIDVVLLILVLFVGIATVRSRSLLSSTMLMGIYSLIMALVWANMFAMDVAFTEAAVGAGISTVLLLGTMVIVGREEKPTRGAHFPALIVTGAVGAALIYGTLDMPDFGDPEAPVHNHVAPLYIKQDVGHTTPIDGRKYDRVYMPAGASKSTNRQHEKPSNTRMTHERIGKDNDKSSSIGQAVTLGVDAQKKGSGDFGGHVHNLVTGVLADYRSYDTMFETAVIFAAGVCLILLLRTQKPSDAEEEAA